MHMRKGSKAYNFLLIIIRGAPAAGVLFLESDLVYVTGMILSTLSALKNFVIVRQQRYFIFLLTSFSNYVSPSLILNKLKSFYLFFSFKVFNNI
jgi:hypothetical protein